MPRQQHIVTLSPAERRTLARLIRTGTATAQEQSHARILLTTDPGTQARRPTDAQVASAVAVSSRTVARVRATYCTQGLTAALARKPPERVYERKLDGAGEAALIELACGPAPDGGTWTLRRLSERLIELHVVESIHHTTVGATLKKTNCARPRSNTGRIRA